MGWPPGPVLENRIRTLAANAQALNQSLVAFRAAGTQIIQQPTPPRGPKRSLIGQASATSVIAMLAVLSGFLLDIVIAATYGAGAIRASSPSW